MDKNLGLVNKYCVSRMDGKEMGPCIVLEFSDPIARKGIETWARAMRDEGYEKVYKDVMQTLVLHVLKD